MDEPPAARHEYFLLQVHAEQRRHPPVVTGVLEDLRTGRRFPFGTLEDLTRLIHLGPGPRESDPNGTTP